jgi:hypothetical protein
MHSESNDLQTSNTETNDITDIVHWSCHWIQAALATRFVTSTNSLELQ